MASPLVLRWFGASEVLVQGAPLPPLRYRKDLWLLAYLTLRHDRAVTRSAVAALFWPDAEESLALYYLRRSLSNLRRALGPEADRLLTPSPQTLQIDLSDADCDVVAFDSALTRLAVSAQPEESLQQAVSLYRGPLLPECSDDWAIAERNARTQSYLSALECLATIYQERNEPALAVRWLRQLVAAEPFRESSCRALMQALANSGDRTALEQVYREMVQLLRRDLNTAPSPETDALYHSLHSLGTRSSQPVALLRLSPEPSGPPQHLPVPLSDLIGREEEREEVCRLLGNSRLVTLLGPGGVGKTRLAIAAAEQMLERFNEGVWFADLAPLNAPAQTTPTLLRLFGLPEDSQSPSEQNLAQALASRTLLLILDNCEHLLESCASIAHQLLSTCPDLRILATSREALGLVGEYVYRVPSLPLPPVGQRDEEKDASALLGYAAVRLFVERARQASGSFPLSRSNIGAVVQICHRLDGIPLALELAAARVKALSLTQIAARLDDRFHLLTGGNRAALPRQRTLQMAIDWSHDLLSEEESALFRRLSVFAGYWSLEAAEAVCADPPLTEDDVLDVLTHLVEKSLVVFEERAEGTARYGLLESMRQYGGERLAEAGETEIFRKRHRDYFLEWAEAAEPHFYGLEQSIWYARVEKEYDNLRAALDWCHSAADKEVDIGATLRLTGALSAFWDVRGYHKEGLAYQRAALSRTGTPHAAARAKVLLAAAQLSARQHDFALATTLLEECLTLQQELGDRPGVGRVLIDLADVAFRLGDPRLAHAHCESSLKIAQESGNRADAIGALNMLGQLSLHEGDYPRACSFYEECLAIGRELGDTRCIAGSLRGLGHAADKQNDHVQARSLYEQSLAIDRELGDRQAILFALSCLGNLARSVGDYERAGSYHKECLALRREWGDRFAVLPSLEDFANLAARQGQHGRAARLLGAVTALYQTRGRDTTVADPEEYVRTLEIARAALGKESFVAEWEKGRTMTMEQSIEYALERPTASSPEKSSIPSVTA